jgi:hypothetical protein
MLFNSQFDSGWQKNLGIEELRNLGISNLRKALFYFFHLIPSFLNSEFSIHLAHG